MNKSKYKTNNLLSKVVNQYPKDFREIDDKLFCSLCEKFNTFDSRHGWT